MNLLERISSSNGDPQRTIVALHLLINKCLVSESDRQLSYSKADSLLIRLRQVKSQQATSRTRLAVGKNEKQRPSQKGVS